MSDETVRTGQYSCAGHATAIGEPAEAEPETIESLRSALAKTKSLQQGSDRAYQETAKKLKEAEGRLAKSIDGDRVAARLSAIEKRYRDKENILELNYFARERALAAGIDFALIAEIPFKNREHVEAKVAALGQFLADSKQRELEAKLLATSKPQAGLDPGSHAAPSLQSLEKTIAGIGF